MAGRERSGFVRFDGVSKRYHLSGTGGLLRSLLGPRRGGDSDTLWALREVSFQVGPGDALAIVGPNGAGKSTILKLLAGIMRPTRGSVEVQGKVACLIEVGAGFHPELTGRENIYLNGAIMGMPRRLVRRRLEAIVEYAGIGAFLDVPVKRYSTGMFMRLGFSVAVHTDPDVLLVDEVLAVGDYAFQRKCLDTINTLRREGVAIVLVSHNLFSVLGTCPRALWLERGRIRREGASPEVVRAYEAHSARSPGFEGPEVGRSVEGDGVRIAEAVLVGAGGPTCPELPSGADLEVELVLEVLRPLPSPVLSCGIARADGLPCASSNTRLEHNPAPDLPPGRHRFRVQAFCPRLVPGRYWVCLQVHDTRQTTPLARRTLPVRVTSTAPNIKPEDYGVFLLDQRWQLLESHVPALAEG